MIPYPPSESTLEAALKELRDAARDYHENRVSVRFEGASSDIVKKLTTYRLEAAIRDVDKLIGVDFRKPSV